MSSEVEQLAPVKGRSARRRAPGCPICESLARNEPRYATEVLADGAHAELNAEAIADALGFCGVHGVEIQSHEGLAEAIGAVMLRAVSRTITLFEAPPSWQDRLREVLFGARSACPACSFAERRLSGLVARHASLLRENAAARSASVRALCLPHFDALLRESELPDLVPWLSLEVDGLGVVDAALQEHGERALATVTRWVAGPMADKCLATNPERRCPVCRAVDASRTRWLALLEDSLRTDAAPEMLLPMCARHIVDCHRTGDARLAFAATRHALGVSLTHLRRAVHVVAAEERKLELAKQSVWYRKKSPAYLLGQRRRVIRDLPRCPACERAVLAAERALSQVLEALREDRAWRPPCGDSGLCMKHFAAARILGSSAGAREALVGMQTAALRSLEARLAESRAAHWKDAVARFTGSSC